jgi:predicted ATP-grasp superfamily ATP-dependent carboligase
MEHVRFTGHPDLREPVVVAAFEGWNDAGDAASTAARYLRDRWDAEEFASIDPEEFYDFTSTRPHAQIGDDGTREVHWPAVELHAADGAVQAVILVGSEPQLRWRTFCDQIVGVVRECGARMVVILGALLAEVPHDRPIRVVGTADDEELAARLGLRRSRYEGPTGIVGVLQDRCRLEGIPSVSLWATVPSYVPSAPSPKAALALVERAAELLGVGVVTTDLEILAASYERQVTELVAGDEDMAEYVAGLASRYEAEAQAEAGEEHGEALVEEVERFLREQRRRE